MTLYENDVEMFSMLQDEMEEFKQASKNDADFKAYLTEVGAKEALYLATSLHRQVADQIKAYNDPNAVLNEGVQKWLNGAVYLCSNVKKRRQELRRVVVHVYGQEAVDEINERVLDESEDLA